MDKFKHTNYLPFNSLNGKFCVNFQLTNTTNSTNRKAMAKEKPTPTKDWWSRALLALITIIEIVKGVIDSL